MNIEDAREVLTDLLNKRIDDSLIVKYEINEKNYIDLVTQQKTQINDLTAKSVNQESQKKILLSVIDNKNTEVGLLNNTIKTQTKEIHKQKFLKVLGFAGAIIVPIAAIILK
jgi:HAMP domain-containing protein